MNPELMQLLNLLGVFGGQNPGGMGAGGPGMGGTPSTMPAPAPAPLNLGPTPQARPMPAPAGAAPPMSGGGGVLGAARSILPFLGGAAAGGMAPYGAPSNAMGQMQASGAMGPAGQNNISGVAGQMPGQNWQNLLSILSPRFAQGNAFGAAF